MMPIYGTNGLIDDHLFFFNRKIKEAYLVFDADDAGRNASRSVSEQLKEKISSVMSLSCRLRM